MSLSSIAGLDHLPPVRAHDLSHDVVGAIGEETLDLLMGIPGKLLIRTLNPFIGGKDKEGRFKGMWQNSGYNNWVEIRKCDPQGGG